jgi:hypothetical protein
MVFRKEDGDWRVVHLHFPRPAPRRDRAACEPRQAIMAGLPRIAIRLDGALPPQECVRLAQAVEANHFSALWFAENPFARSVPPAATPIW